MSPVEELTNQGEGVYTLTLSPAANQLLFDLARESGESGGDLIRKGLGLLKLAMDAHKEGKRIGIAGEGQPLETVIDLS